MGISNVIRESYCAWSWFLPLATGAIGALIGTYGGACFLQRKQEHKVKNVAISAINLLNHRSNLFTIYWDFFQFDIFNIKDIFRKRFKWYS